ncbi:M3 family metallopeptidase [Sphingosinicella sp. LHD-64]|uniref:M3 family metallopeptidase n=1 Tax=Sphingosinicella sp. LHD-64 TaxID=3072139 RepID=UPI0028103A33|nr:M3 family metallopeptidase [Sphingosinicella sp. LHD-64]MDQ8755375.1 M3 family metallopeptidase [Sphingosinicella sp. LHD-64]
MKAVLLASAALMAVGASAVFAQGTTGGGAPASTTAPVPGNVLLADWTGPSDGVPPFDRVRPELFPEAFQFAIDEQRREVAAITASREAPTFANTIEAMERAGRRLGRVGAVFGVMSSNMSNPEYQAAQREWGPRLAAASDAIILNPELFQRVRAVYEARERSGLDAQQQRVVTRYYEQFTRRGANLNPEQKQQLSAYNQELARLFAQFSEKLLADEQTFVTAGETDMAGVPADVRNAAAAAARERNLPAGQFAIVNTRSAVDPVLTFADNRSLRERVWRAFVNRGDNGNANDTNETIRQIVRVRAQRARLLGFPSHAHWRMQDTMAGTPERGQELMMRVWPAAVARVREEVAEQQAIARAAGQDITIEPWDYRYYMEKVRQQRYNLSQDEIKPYFQLDRMIEGMFYMADQLYGFQFQENTGQVPVWHPDIRTWRVTDREGNDVGIFYGDMFARTGKRSGAWATTYRSRSGLLGDRLVLGSNNNNFTKPGAGEPVLISVDDATTLFHEFGHAIHFFLSNTRYPNLARTPQDFVEYPSQVHENWLLTPEILSRFARHYQTGEVMPQALVDRIVAARQFNQGFETVEYLSSALVDMALHVRPDGEVDPDAFERETLAAIGMPREIVMRHRLPQFGHLFSSDAYSAGYYSYLWSETMDADTWAAFGEAGNVWDPATARRFAETLLSTGNETDRAEAYRAFRGRDPDVNALLRKRGFPTGE